MLDFKVVLLGLIVRDRPRKKKEEKMQDRKNGLNHEFGRFQRRKNETLEIGFVDSIKDNNGNAN